MATEATVEPTGTPTQETSGQGDNTNTDTSSQTTSEPEGNGQQQGSTAQQDTRLPDDHPLVTALERQKQANTELKEQADKATELTTKVTELETQITDLTTKAQSAEAVQAKYDRLEQFLTSLGGPISKALDSKSFSTALFESDADIKDLVAQWHRDNPSATSAALQSGAGDNGTKIDPNVLLRAAAGK